MIFYNNLNIRILIRTTKFFLFSMFTHFFKLPNICQKISSEIIQQLYRFETACLL